MQRVPVERADLSNVVGCNVEHPELPSFTVVKKKATWEDLEGRLQQVLLVGNGNEVLNSIILMGTKGPVLFTWSEQQVVSEKMGTEHRVDLSLISPGGTEVIPARIELIEDDDPELTISFEVESGLVHHERWAFGHLLKGAGVLM